MFTENKGKYIVDTVKNMACLIVDIKGETYICTPWKNVGQLSDALISAMSDRGLIVTLNANTVSTAPNYEIVAESPFTNDGGNGGGGDNGGGGTTVILNADMTVSPESQGFTYHLDASTPITSDGTKWVTSGAGAGATQMRYALPANATQNILEIDVISDMPWSNSSTLGVFLLNSTKSSQVGMGTAWDESSQNVVGIWSGQPESGGSRPQGGAGGSNKEMKIKITRLSASQVQFDLFYDGNPTAFLQNVLNWDLADDMYVYYSKWQDVGPLNITKFEVTKTV